jgi:hypothetical protein
MQITHAGPDWITSSSPGHTFFRSFQDSRTRSFARTLFQLRTTMFGADRNVSLSSCNPAIHFVLIDCQFCHFLPQQLILIFLLDYDSLSCCHLIKQHFNISSKNLLSLLYHSQNINYTAHQLCTSLEVLDSLMGCDLGNICAKAER